MSHKLVLYNVPGYSSSGYEHTFASDGEISGSSSESEFEPGGKRSKKRKQKRGNSRAAVSPSDFTRTTGRNRGVVSYKDFDMSEGEGAEEGEEADAPLPVVEDNRETVERILKCRVGAVGGMHVVCMWCVWCVLKTGVSGCRQIFGNK